MANHLPIEKKIMILNMLCEGSSMRSISRVVDCSINTVTKILVEAGQKCEALQNEYISNIPCQRVEVDEMWSFCYGKTKKIPAEKAKIEGYGDNWTWTAVCPDSKLVLCWYTGSREVSCAIKFLFDLRNKVSGKPQLTSDGNGCYIQAVEQAFGNDVNYGMLVKRYADKELTLEKKAITGVPDMNKLSTSAVERQNFSMRMGMRRFTRKTNAHSKKIENHNHALALYFFYHNFIRINPKLKVTPAIEANITDKLWEWKDLV